MPNTVIALKKSATPSAAPASLANGELAINFADGKLYYKHANGTIAAISSGGAGDSFGTVNAAGTLIIADTAGDILTLEAGSGITITGDAINDKITIAATTADISPAFTQANTARDHANAAFLEANSAETIAIASFGQANTARTHANAAFGVANAALPSSSYTASDVLTKLLTVDGSGSTLDADLLDGQHGTYYGIATDVTSAFTQANTARIHANTAHASANAGLLQANTARDHANAAFLEANTAETIAIASFGQANTARIHANASHASANAGLAQANTARDHANTAHASANAGLAQANTARDHANTAHASANAGMAIANAAFASANAGQATGNASYAFGNSAHSIANLAFTHANAAFAHANAAFLSSNSVNTFSNATYVKLTAASQTITGSLAITGNLTVSGNTTVVNAENLRVTDPLIYLAGNNYSSDIVDIGFIGNYVNATGQNVHTGLYREHADKMYYLFQGYDAEPINNHIGALSNNMTLAVLNADIRTSNLVLGGANAILTIGASFNHANAAHASANAGMAIGNAAFAAANAGLLQANTARDHANTAHASANAGMAIANGAFASANAGQATANAAFNRANTANITADRAWNHANAAFATVNSAFATANAALPNTSGVSFNGTLFFPSGNIVVGAAVLQGFKFAVLGGALGTGAGNTVNAWSSSATTASSDKLVHIIERNADGVDWTTANHKLARIVDVTTMGYMKFGSFLADLITFGEGSTEYLRIDGSGNVLIGRTNSTVGNNVKLDVNGAINASAVLINGAPALTGGITSNVVISVADNTNAALRITQTGTGEAIRVEDSANPDSTPFVVDASGQVGFGTATPFPLTSTFISTRDPLVASDGSYIGGGAYWDGATWRSTVASQGGWVIRNTTGMFTLWTGYNSGAANTVPPVFSERLRVDGNGNVGIGTTAPTTLLSVNGVASFGAGTAALPSVAAFGDLDTGMWFPAGGTVAWSTNGIERMRILSDGNIGIGNTTPTHKLQVSGTSYFNGVAKFAVGAWHVSDDNKNRFFYGINGRTYFGSGDGSYEFRNSSDAGTVFIDTSGNVGIGITSPTSLLHVNGTANIVSTLTVAQMNVVPTIQAAFAAANAGQATANAGMAIGNGAFAAANAGLLQANTARDHANTAHASANAGQATANTALTTGQAAFGQANTALTTGQAAFAQANSRVSSVSGTGTVSGISLSGTVTSSGSLTLGGTLSASVIDNMTDEHRLFNNMGDNHATRTSFDATNPSYNFGWRFVQGATNGPGTGSQYYSEYVGLGNDYLATGAGSYGMQIAYPRNVTEPYIAIRYNENNTLGAWQKISAGNSDKLNGQASTFYSTDTKATAAFSQANSALGKAITMAMIFG